MCDLQAVDSYSTGAREDGFLQAGIGKDLGDIHTWRSEAEGGFAQSAGE